MEKRHFINWYLVLFESSGVSDCLSAKLKMSEMTTYGKKTRFGLKGNVEQLRMVLHNR